MKRILCTGLALVFACTALIAQKKPIPNAEEMPAENRWWKEAIVYQIYPRSFQDSDGDGIGDLRGIISRLDYLKSLGINAVWLNPVYESPNDDNGYDVSDYRGIMKDFGTMKDFDELLKGMHDRGIKVVMDLVVNHSSDEHEWFKQSRSSRTSPYRDYYHWWNAERGHPNYRYSLFDINNDAWMYDSLTNAYYLHYFSRKQPDLNWENPKLRQEVYDMMAFWAKKGIDGFRLDAFQFASKDTAFPNWPAGWQKDFGKYYAMGPNLHQYLKEMNTEVLAKYNLMSVAEGAGNSLQDAHDMVDEDRNELSMAYAFDGVDIAKRNGYSVLHFKEVFSHWDSAFAQKGWISIFLANHDQARLVSRYGNESPAFREVSAKMLNTFLLTMRGTPYLYYGDELGMTNAHFTRIEQYNDMPTLNRYKYLQMHGGNLDSFMTEIQFGCRDNGRTPFPWNTQPNAGFTTGKPWLEVNSNYTTINAAAQEKDPNSVLNYFRKMVQLRKSTPALVYGKYELVDKNNPDVYAYTRTGRDGKYLVVLNFTNHNATYNAGAALSKRHSIICNYPKPSPNTKLKPYEAAVYRIL